GRGRQPIQGLRVPMADRFNEGDGLRRGGPPDFRLLDPPTPALSDRFEAQGGLGPLARVDQDDIAAAEVPRLPAGRAEDRGAGALTSCPGNRAEAVEACDAERAAGDQELDVADRAVSDPGSEVPTPPCIGVRRGVAVAEPSVREVPRSNVV